MPRRVGRGSRDSRRICGRWHLGWWEMKGWVWWPSLVWVWCRCEVDDGEVRVGTLSRGM